MDFQVDTLSGAVEWRIANTLVPYDAACVILADDELRLFVARNAPKSPGGKDFTTLQTTDSPLLQRVLIERKSVYVPDTDKEADWREIKPLAASRSWMGIPLITASGMFGLLSIGASRPHRFTSEHLRLAKSMAAAAAVAIYNVRLHERTEIYASELQHYIDKLKETQKQLERGRGQEANQS